MRPRFHFSSPRGWMNDPHGITFHDGGYHLFFQSVPDSLVWRLDCRWGHAISRDLYSFEVLPDALVPGDGDDGVWSGSLVVDDDGEATMFYTSISAADVSQGRVRTARPADPGWSSWTKGPVVVGTPPGVHSFRDPFVRRDPDSNGWQMFVGTSIDGSAAGSAFTSTDLATWEPAGLVASRRNAERDPVWTGSLWECPQIFRIDGRDVMVTSVWDEDELYYAAYALGTMIGGRFVAQTWGRLTYGDSHYAPTYFLDADGRSCLMFWLRGIEGDGWTGAHSVPHVLGLQGDRLVASPHPNIERRRRPGDILNTVDSLAADATWEGTGLVITSGGNPVAQLAVDADVAVTVGRVTQRMPYDRGSVRVMVDGPVLEVSTSAGLLAMPITPSGSALTFEGDGTLWLYSVL